MSEHTYDDNHNGTVQIVDVDAYRKKMDMLAKTVNRQDDEREDAKRLRLLQRYEEDLCSPKRVVMPDDGVEAGLAELVSRSPNAREVLTDIIGMHRLTNRHSTKVFRLPTAILLVGEPGTGKSRVAYHIAKMLGLESETLRMGSVLEAFHLTGLHLGYSTGTPGEIAVRMSSHTTANWLMLLDEVDKGGANRVDRPSAFEPLLQIMERETATAFKDIALDIEIDCSYLGGFIATANDTDGLPEPLLDRFSVYEIARPDKDEMVSIVRNIWVEICHEEGWQWVLKQELDDAVAEKLSVFTPRQAKHVLRQAAVRRANRLAGNNSRRRRVKLELKDLDGVTLAGNRRRGIGFNANF